MKPIKKYTIRIIIGDKDGGVYEDFYVQQSSNQIFLAASQVRQQIEKQYKTYEVVSKGV